MSAKCCNDFSRAQRLRGGDAAVAGAGLPDIEPGMPVPAGTGLSRRSFLAQSAGLAMAVYGGSKFAAPLLEEGIAEAATAGDNRVLVSVFMPGGVDSLSLLAPVGDSRYATLRPTLALGADEGTAFAEDPAMRWHPAAASLAQLHAEGKVSVFPAVGYTTPDQSHFTSRHFWEVGELSASSRLGWMGRYLDVVGSSTNPLQGLALSGTLAPQLAAGKVPVAAVSKPEDYSFWAQHIGDPITGPMMKAFGDLGRLPASSTAMKQARGAARDTDLVRTAMAPFKDGAPPVPYPTAGGDFPKRMAALARMLSGGLPIRCVAVNAPGQYDTHSGQESSLARDLKATFDGLLAFQRDLEARGLADRVLVQVWSEFGRRPRENGTGTDHGAAGCAFVIGSRAKGEMVGEFPGLTNLDPHSNLRATSDFRAMYCSLLEQWMGFDAARVIPNAASFGRPVLVK
jgi:uncharacterized protein (DUF1501 family)